MREVWRAVDGYEGHYEVSNRGRLRRVETGRVLRPRMCRGYVSAALHAGGVKYVRVHRLVAMAFLRPPLPGHHHINHKDGNKSNNFVENLEWTNPSKNMRHAYDIGTKKRLTRAQHGRSKLTDKDVRRIKRRTSTPRADLARQFGVHVSTIGRIMRGEC